MLNFLPFSLDKKELLDSYFFAYGEGSCQHSFVSSFCMSEKYGDKFAIKDNFLFILREKRCTEDERVYLFPLGDIQDVLSVRRAVDSVIEDAHSHNAKVRFETVTEKAKNFLAENYSELFSITESRDVSEYIYDRGLFVGLQGRNYRDFRWHVNRCKTHYGEHLEVRPITPDYFDEICKFEDEWYSKYCTEESRAQLSNERVAIKNGIHNFCGLGFFGIVVLIDGVMKGFMYGMKLDDDTCDAMIAKADREGIFIYSFLYHSFVELCCKNYKWLNLEEDLGDPGLRYSKLAYRPDHFLKKYIISEWSCES